jgi:hypothetical protein
VGLIHAPELANRFLFLPLSAWSPPLRLQFKNQPILQFNNSFLAMSFAFQ